MLFFAADWVAMSQACLECVTKTVDRWAEREGDTPKEKVTKRCFCIFLMATWLPCILAYFAAVGRDSTVGQVISVTTPVIALALVLYLRVARQADTFFVSASVCFTVSAIVCFDMVHTAEANRRLWPVAIILIDILLVTQAHEALTIVAVASIIVHLMVM
eukprot:Rhum_TRINITY_DN15268_c13_g1::Rhum_TRINITY_DN15268_c13_g1_i1::g.147644::m.147644